LINRLIDVTLRVGRPSIVWNDKDRQNRSATSGIYLILIEFKASISVRIASLMK